MSASQFVSSVPVFQGAQGKFYLVDGQKYHIRFPIDWAHNHTYGNKQWDDYDLLRYCPGPALCENCKTYGSIRGVFVGYCCNCLQNLADNGEPRGELVAMGLGIDYLQDPDMWKKYPYMYGVKKTDIGDEDGDDITDEGIDLERLASTIIASEKEEAINEEDKMLRQSAYCEAIRDECIDVEETFGDPWSEEDEEHSSYGESIDL